MTTNRCRASRCGRYVRAGAVHCPKHEERTEESDRPDPAAERRLEFLERLEQGEYAALFDEIGALRFVMAKLLAEENDPAKLASSVTRVVTAAMQAARTGRAIGGESAEGLTSALTQILAELDEG